MPISMLTIQNEESYYVRIISSEYRDVYVEYGINWEGSVQKEFIRILESAGLRPVTVWDEQGRIDESALVRIIASSCAVIVPTFEGEPEMLVSCLTARIARCHQVPILSLRFYCSGPRLDIEGCGEKMLSKLCTNLVGQQPYAFMAVRIHDDFHLVREALRVAVETELGIPCVYFEDRRVITNIVGVRERTCELIRRATFFVADLTYSDSCPSYDSPNTAHEIGIATACRIPIVVCAQAPRRNLYFSAGNLDTIFWRDETDLFELLRSWLRPRRFVLGRRVLSFELQDSCFQASRFQFDPARQYVGPSRIWSRALSGLASYLDIYIPTIRSKR